MNTSDPIATQLAEGFIMWIFGVSTQPLVIPSGKAVYASIHKGALPFAGQFLTHLNSGNGDPFYVWKGAQTDSEKYLERALMQLLADEIRPWLVAGESPAITNKLSVIAKTYFGTSALDFQIASYTEYGRLPAKQLPLKTILEAAILAILTAKGDRTDMGMAVERLSRSLQTPTPGFGSSEGFQSVFLTP